MYENYCVFFYFVMDKIPEEERQARELLMELKDLKLRQQLASPFNKAQEFEKRALIVGERLTANKFFRSIPTKRQKELLQGNKDFFLTLTELNQRVAEHQTHPP